MKNFKKMLSLLMAAALIALLPGANTLKAAAATPTTYYVRYDTDQNDWRMQIGEWLEDYEGRETYYLNNGDEAVKDGDILVILDNGTTEAGSELTVNAHLSNLTVNRAHAVISTGGVDECYVLGSSYAAITGSITNAYVYDDAVCTFNSNVTNLKLISSQENDVNTDISVGGTVAYASVSNPGGVLKEYYNFTANSFYYDHASGLMTDPSRYSTTGSAPAPAPAQGTTAQNTTASQTATQPQSGSGTSSGEYDDVPKTGENNLLFVSLLALSAASFAGCMALNLKRRLRKER